MLFHLVDAFLLGALGWIDPGPEEIVPVDTKGPKKADGLPLQQVSSPPGAVLNVAAINPVSARRAEGEQTIALSHTLMLCHEELAIARQAKREPLERISGLMKPIFERRKVSRIRS